MHILFHVYLIGEGLILATGELWLHERVIEEGRHVVLLSKRRNIKFGKRCAGFLVAKLHFDMEIKGVNPALVVV